ncbi:MAG: NAD(P)-dependent oxidoreductase [Actinomycetota bacterium]
MSWPEALIGKLIDSLDADHTIVVAHHHHDQVHDALRRAEVAIIGGNADERFVRAPHLHWLHIDHAGIDRFAPPELLANRTVTTSAGRNSEAIAEEAFYLLHAVARRSRSIERHRRWHVWTDDGDALRPLRGRRALLVGGGSIATCIAERAAAFEMPVTVVRRRDESPTPAASRVVASPDRDEFIALCAEHDVLILAAPLTDATHRMIGAAELAALGADGILVNVSRGGLVDQRALLAALRRRAVGGAGLAVAEPEPLPPWSPLWHAPNTVITPHAAARGDDRDERSYHIVEHVWSQLRLGRPVDRALTQADAYTHRARRHGLDRSVGVVWRRTFRRLARIH